MLVLRADGCSLCIAMDAVDGMFATPKTGTPAPCTETIRWSQVSGVGAAPAEADPATSLVVVRTPRGRIGLEVEACVGVRDVSFLASPPIPTRWTDEAGEPLGYLLVLDGAPHVLVEPRAFCIGAEAQGPGSAIPAGSAVVEV